METPKYLRIIALISLIFFVTGIFFFGFVLMTGKTELTPYVALTVAPGAVLGISAMLKNSRDRHGNIDYEEKEGE